MKKLFLVTFSLFALGAQAQVSVYDCGSMNSVVTQNEVLAGAYGFYRPCIDFVAANNYLFQGDVHKEIKALEYIDIKENFHAGPFNLNKGMHFVIEEKALFDVAVMNYPDLNCVQKLKKVEFGIDLEGDIEDRIKDYLSNPYPSGTLNEVYKINPFLDWDLDIDAVFTHVQSGTVKHRDFFYYHDYEQVANEWDDAINDNNDHLMRVRFAPPLEGIWDVAITVKVKGAIIAELPSFNFNVCDNSHPGYVKVHANKRNLQLGSSIVFPLSHVFPGPYNRAGGDWTPWGDPGVPPDYDPSKNTTVADWNQYIGDIASYIEMGGKSFKMVQTSYGNLLEFEEKGNYYKRMHYAWEQDKILEMCEDNEVLINFNLLFQDVIMGYGQNGDGVAGDPWDYGNYKQQRDVNGDPEINPNDYFQKYCYFEDGEFPSHMFLTDNLMNYHKQRTRYYVARYGYSPQIYTWELMSEPFHMDQFDGGVIDIIDPSTNALMSDEPATKFTHPRHSIAIDAINAYHDQLSEYIKNELKDTDHLITLDQSIVDEIPVIYPWQCAGNAAIDIIGYNWYDGRPNKLIEAKMDKNGKNNLDVEYHNNEVKNENSAYKMFFRKFEQIQKPIILSEAGHGSQVLSIQCFGNSGNIIDAMTLGFTGIAGMHPWEGYNYGHPGYYNENLLWPSTIAAEIHMNSDKVIPVLDNWNGTWKQGRQMEYLFDSFDPNRPKELQYYLAQSNELATGYVRNRSHNINTMSVSPTCVPSNFDGFGAPLNYFFPFTYEMGSEFNYDRYLYVYGLQKNTWYEIKWYDFITGNQLPLTQVQETDNKFRMKLQFPALTYLRPILWFSMEKFYFNLSPEANDPETKSASELFTTKEENFFIHPNPFEEQFVVHSDRNDVIEIYSITGAFVSSHDVHIGETRITTNGLNKGVYFVHSTITGVNIKLIKQ